MVQNILERIKTESQRKGFAPIHSGCILFHYVDVCSTNYLCNRSLYFGRQIIYIGVNAVFLVERRHAYNSTSFDTVTFIGAP
nr:unnamed protein product [Haemonchus contortus]